MPSPSGSSVDADEIKKDDVDPLFESYFDANYFTNGAYSKDPSTFDAFRKESLKRGDHMIYSNEEIFLPLIAPSGETHVDAGINVTASLARDPVNHSAVSSNYVLHHQNVNLENDAFHESRDPLRSPRTDDSTSSSPPQPTPTIWQNSPEHIRDQISKMIQSRENDGSRGQGKTQDSSDMHGIENSGYGLQMPPSLPFAALSSDHAFGHLSASPYLYNECGLSIGKQPEYTHPAILDRSSLPPTQIPLATFAPDLNHLDFQDPTTFDLFKNSVQTGMGDAPSVLSYAVPDSHRFPSSTMQPAYQASHLVNRSGVSSAGSGLNDCDSFNQNTFSDPHSIHANGGAWSAPASILSVDPSLYEAHDSLPTSDQRLTLDREDIRILESHASCSADQHVTGPQMYPCGSQPYPYNLPEISPTSQPHTPGPIRSNKRKDKEKTKLKRAEDRAGPWQVRRAGGQCYTCWGQKSPVSDVYLP